ncbi:MAG TPA: CpsB/CapC family capsule biosynthesis tyrosine phosphatase [Gemmatimonadales bacterium]|nr:CpsB/CapC family capsule biosynthesis tyrosine phosphatase [Gemmatimonadales bacterium]
MTSSDPQLPGLVDLHSHLVPGVDDGTASLEESLSALTSLYQQGVRAVVTTPHLLVPHLETEAALDRELSRHRRAFEPLASLCATRSDLPVVKLGQEILAPTATDIQRVVNRDDVGLNGVYLLVEFGFDLSSTHFDVIQAVLAAGRQIVIAHPERYTYLSDQDPLGLMQQWRRLGAMLQVNVGSLTGHYRRSSPHSEQLAWRMAELELIDVLASDHHGPRRIGVSPEEARKALIARGHGALAQRAMVEIPASIVGSDLLTSRLPG